MASRILTVLIWGCVCLVAKALEPEERSDQPRFNKWVEYYQQVAEAYSFRKGNEQQWHALKIADHPLMTYAHPWGGGTTHGAFFIWTHRGRPELVCAIWSAGPEDGPRPIFHEFHSLSSERLAPTRVGRLVWRPDHGIELRPVPGAAAPNDKAALRLAQMRSLAREFTGYSTPHGRELTLRTSPQPLYRYESELPEVIDGAVFAMFADWDPDIILLLEAREVEGTPAWYYGIGRFNGCPLRLEHKGTEVWKEGLVPLRVPTSNFFSVLVERRILPTN